MSSTTPAAWGTPMKGWTATLDILLLWCLSRKWKISHNSIMPWFLLLGPQYLFWNLSCIFISHRIRDSKPDEVFCVSSASDRNNCNFISPDLFFVFLLMSVVDFPMYSDSSIFLLISENNCSTSLWWNGTNVDQVVNHSVQLQFRIRT